MPSEPAVEATPKRYAFIDVANTKSTTKETLGFSVAWDRLYKLLTGEKWGCKRLFYYEGSMEDWALQEASREAHQARLCGQDKGDIPSQSEGENGTVYLHEMHNIEPIARLSGEVRLQLMRGIECSRRS